MRPVNLDRRAHGQVGQVGQVIGKEALLHPVDAQLKAVAAGSRAQWSRRASAACRSRPRHGRNELAGKVVEVIAPFDLKHEVIALGNFRDAFFAH